MNLVPAEAGWPPAEVDGVSGALSFLATAAEATARSCLRRCELWIVGLLRTPSLSLVVFVTNKRLNYEGLPAPTRLGVGPTDSCARMTFTSPSETLPVHASIRGFRAGRSPPCDGVRPLGCRFWLLSWGCPKISPPSTSVQRVLSSLRLDEWACFAPPGKTATLGCLRRYVLVRRSFNDPPTGLAVSASTHRSMPVPASLGLLRLPVRAPQPSATRMPPSPHLPPLPFLPASTAFSA
jgi:hypothetical protein